jgi:hypothetical protein
MRGRPSHGRTEQLIERGLSRDAALRLSASEYMRRRYANDPKFREKQKEYSRQRYWASKEA